MSSTSSTRLVLLLLLLGGLTPAQAQSEQTVNGLPFADEYVWRPDYWIHDEARRPTAAETWAKVDSLARSATELLQRDWQLEDQPCPISELSCQFVQAGGGCRRDRVTR